MTTMQIDRAVVEQALEALEVATTPLTKDRQEVLRAQAALRAALAQQAEPVPCPSCEELGYVPLSEDGRSVFIDGAGEVPLAQQAEPVKDHVPGVRKMVQEPVAWRCACGANLYIDAQGRPASKAEQPAQSQQAPLMQEIARLHDRVKDLTLDVEFLSQPPQRKPLTEEEIDVTTAQERDALLDHIYEYGTAAEGVLERIRKLCRAVERAHGIKE